MAKTRKLRRKGGALLGQGSYGCVFRPALACKGNTRNRPDQISKLMDGVDAIEELKQRDLFRTVDPTQKYFLYPFEICDPKLPFNAENNVKKCKVPMKLRKILQSLDGGESISVIKVDAADYPAFFNSITNLFEGLEKAHAKDVIHNDIKPDNIVVAKTDKGQFNTRFIDFGISFKWDDLDEISKNKKSPFKRNRYGHSFFDGQYDYWSIEVSFVNPHRVNKRKVIHDFYKKTIHKDKTIPYRMFYKKTPGGNVEKAVIDETYLTWLEDKLEKMTPTEKYKFIFEKDDVYALGRTLSQIFYQRFGQRDEGMSAPHIVVEHNPLKFTTEMASRFAEEVATPCYKLVRGMMSPDIRTRFSMKVASKMYDDKVLPAINKFFKALD
jgi:hypothetical protein